MKLFLFALALMPLSLAATAEYQDGAQDKEITEAVLPDGFESYDSSVHVYGSGYKEGTSEKKEYSGLYNPVTRKWIHGWGRFVRAEAPPTPRSKTGHWEKVPDAVAFTSFGPSLVLKLNHEFRGRQSRSEALPVAAKGTTPGTKSPELLASFTVPITLGGFGLPAPPVLLSGTEVHLKSPWYKKEGHWTMEVHFNDQDSILDLGSNAPSALNVGQITTTGNFTVWEWHR